MASFNKTDIDYDSLKRAASHYRGEVGYCSLIAFAVTTGCKFGKVRSLFKGIRQRGGGTHKMDTHPIYVKHGYRFEEMYFNKGFTLKTAVNRLPRTGTFLVYSSCHVTCIKDGVNHDWSATSTRTKRMVRVYQVLAA